MRKYFGTDGIRRIANTELTPELVYKVAKAGAYVLSKHTDHTPTILIGRDTRISGTLIESAMVAGFLSYGANVKKPATIALSISVPDILVSLPIKIVGVWSVCLESTYAPAFATLYTNSGDSSVFAILLIPSVPKYFLIVIPSFLYLLIFVLN